jgi:alpha-tubulin suppressor-like RCC1 family protein
MRSSRLAALWAVLAVPAVILVACNDEDVVPIQTEPDGGDAAPAADASEPDAAPPVDAGVDAPFDGPPVTIACSVTPCAVELATTGASTCARLDDGTVRCWGADDYGQLGRGEIDGGQDSLPAPVVSLASVAHLSAGRDGYCATTQEGAVSCWGDNDDGQLGAAGDRIGYSSNVPVAVAGLPAVIAAFLGDGIACAAPQDGDVVCWGKADNGRIPASDASVDVQPPTRIDLGGRKVRAISPGSSSIVAMLEDATLISWGKRSGLSNSGVTTLGRESSLDPASPASIPAPAWADRLAGWNNAACAASNGGALRWGSLDGINGPVVPVPVTFATAAKVLDVSIGESGQFCAVMNDKSVRCMGDNTFGQLGTGDYVAARLVPGIVKGLTSAPARVVTGGNSACAILDTGAAVCWGQNSRGQLGTGDYVIHATPALVRLSP